jgi:hypothetical protein
MRGACVVLLAGIPLILVPSVAAAEWAVKPGTGAACVVESAPEPISDGYQATTARIHVDGKTVVVSSPSVLDPGFNDIGIAVDDHEIVPMDRLADSRTAVFESRYPAIVEQFKRGLRARVQLRFWPTWPATGVQSATVSLIGFSRAYARRDECR